MGNRTLTPRAIAARLFALFAICILSNQVLADHGGAHINFGLTVPASSSTGSYTVSWNGGLVLQLQEKIDGGSYSQVYIGTASSYSFAGKASGTYTYRIRWQFCFHGCNYWYTEPASIVVSNGIPAPASITGPAGDVDGSFTLTWGTVAGATHYPLERRKDGGAWTVIQDSAAVSRAEVNLDDGVWQYRAKACSPTECSGNWTPIKTASVARVPGVPGAITGPDEVPVSSGAYTLNWGAATGSVSHYSIEENTGTSTTWMSTTTNSRSYAGKPIGTYSYRATACNLVGTFNSCSDWTATKTVSVQNFLNVNLTAPAESVTGSYVVSWNPAGGLTQHLHESVNGGAWTVIHSGTGGSFSVSGRPDGSYRYRVMRITVSGWPEPEPIIEISNSVTTIVGMIPEPPIMMTNAAGNLPYETGVTKGGNGYITIPMEAAPGVNGLQPNLLLSYSSGRDRQRIYENLPGDTLGYGWQLGGIAHIRHCVKNKPDGTEILLDGNDPLCLNGEPLVLLNGSHMQPGAEYRTLRESYHKIVLQGTVNAPWFEVHAPDGGVTEFGNSEDSRVHNVNYVNLFGQQIEIRTKPYLWSITRQRDAFFDVVSNNNLMEYEYYKDEVAGVLHPKSITYGHNDDAEVEFEYVSRSDLDPVTLGTATLNQLLLLHTVRMNLDGQPVREYRLLSETATAGWRRLDQVQLCGFDEAGATHDCFVPFDIDWAEPIATLPDLKTFVERVTDSQDMVTEFVHEAISVSSPHAFVFTEEPFGAPITAPDTRALTPTNGYLKDVVTEMHRNDGLGGWHSTTYAYHGRGLESTRNWGFLGFYASRITDQQSGIVTYHQFRLDFPHFAEVSATHQYDAPFGSATELLTKTETEFASESYQHGNGSTTHTPYRKRITNMLLEGVVPTGSPLGAVELSNTLTVTSGFVTTLNTSTRVAGAVSASSGGGAFWGDVPTYTLSDIKRSVQTDQAFDNVTTSPNWLIGFQDSLVMRHYAGTAIAGNLERTQDAAFARFGSTNEVGSQTNFPNDDDYTLSITSSFGATGYLVTRTVSGDNVSARTSSALNFIQGRYPGVLRNTLNHDTDLTFDARFGTVKSTVDPNNRQTSLQFDGFGREISRTTPDGVVITTAYDRCAVVGCGLVGAVAPVTRIRTTSAVTPTTNKYVDRLGRVVRSEIESFDGTMIRQDTQYDTLGRVDRVSQPYLATGTAHFIDFDYDLRNRIRKETRPDGSYTEVEYTVESGIGIRQTIKDRVLKANGTSLETQEQYKIFDRMGQVVESVDDSDSTDGLAVSTAYSYYASGQPKTVAVDPSGANLVTSFDFDDGGYRTSITAPDIGTLKSKYTALGELREQGYGANGTDLLTSYGYDLLGRLTSKTDQDSVATWTYDTAANGIGRLHTRSYGAGFTETISYNGDASVANVSTQLIAGGHNKTYAHSYLYDSSGRIDRVTYPSGIQVQHAYNSYGYLQAVTDTGSSIALKTFAAIDAYGNVTQESYGNGIQTARLFDPKTGRLTDIDTTLGSSVYQDNQYKWQSNGILENRIKVDGGTTLQENFTYDGLNRLRTATTNLSPTARTLTTDYDDRGNLLFKSSSESADADVTGYQYTPGTNRLTDVTIDGNAYSLSYDQYGNITGYDRSNGDDKFIDWNARNLPSRVTIASSRNTTTPTARDEFEYGPNGQRYYKKSTWQDGSDQWTERTFYVGGFEELVTDAKDTSHKAVQKSRIGGGVLHIKTIDYLTQENSSIEYLHRDHLGSVEAVTNEQGSELRVLAYDPFGERRKEDWKRVLNPIEIKGLADDLRKGTSRGFTGQENLDRTGFVHMNGRIYDPQIGRFLSPDPIVQSPGYSQSWNRYSYVMNSPVSFNDPSGFIQQGPMCSGIVMCANPDTNGAGSGSQSFTKTSRVTNIQFVVSRSRRTVFVGGFGGGDINDGGFRGGFIEVVDYSVRIRVERFDVKRTVQLPDDSLTDQPMTGFELGRFENEIELAKVIGIGIFREFVVAPIEEFAEGKILSGACRLVKVCSAAKRAGSSLWKLGQRVLGKNKDPLPIRGNAQVTRKNGVETGHASTSQRVADEQALRTGDAESVHLNQQLRTITDGDVDSLVRPDVATKRLDGKIDCCEVLSPGQTVEQQQKKILDALGDKAGDIRVIPPD